MLEESPKDAQPGGNTRSRPLPEKDASSAPPAVSRATHSREPLTSRDTTMVPSGPSVTSPLQTRRSVVEGNPASGPKSTHALPPVPNDESSAPLELYRATT